MAYLRAYQAKGDPFLGGVLKGIKSIAKIGGGLLGIGGKGPSAAEIAAKVKAALPGVGAVAGPAVSGAAAGAAGAIIGGALGRGRSSGFAGRSYRRINVGNVKALRRSMRRVQGFAKLAKSTIQFTKTTRMKKRRRS